MDTKGTDGTVDGDARNAVALREARSLLAKSKTLIESNDYKGATPGIEKALVLLEGSGAIAQDWAEALVAFSKVKYYYGDLDKSEALLLKAFEHTARPGTDSLVKADANATYGMVLYSRGDFEKSLEHLNRALMLYEAMKSKQGTASASKGMGNVYLLKGEYARATIYYSKAIKLNQELGNSKEMASSLVNLALAKGYQGMFEDAIKDLTGFLARGSGDIHQRTVAMAYNCLAYFQTRLGRLDEAMANYDKSVELARAIGFNYLERSVVAGVAEVLVLRGELDKAAQMIDNNYKDIMALKGWEQRGEFMMVRGILRKEKGEFAKADDDFSVAERLLEKGGHSFYIPRNYIEWALTRLKAGDRDGAMRLFSKARSHYSTNKLPFLEKELDKIMKALGLQ